MKQAMKELKNRVLHRPGQAQNPAGEQSEPSSGRLRDALPLLRKKLLPGQALDAPQRNATLPAAGASRPPEPPPKGAISRHPPNGWVADALRESPERVLRDAPAMDVGPRDGRDAEWLVNEGLASHVHLVEPDATRQGSLAKLDKGTVHPVGLMDLTGIEDASLGLVVAMNVLHYMPDLDAALARINRLSSPGALFVGAVLLEGHAAVERHQDPGSLHLRSVGEMKEALARGGFHLFHEWDKKGPGELADGTTVDNAPMFLFRARKVSAPKPSQQP